MTEAAAQTTPSTVQEGRPWYKNRKMDQWICFWSVPVFYNLFGLVFVPLTWIQPPQAPSDSLTEIAAYMQSHNLILASAILILSAGLSAIGNAVYLGQIKRMKVSPAFRYAFMAGSIFGAIVGMLFPMFCFGLGAFRPGYDPAIMQMLYDFGYLSFVGCLGSFFLNWSLLGLAIILDENNTLPKWLGYYTVWQSVTEIFATTVWLTQTGPFAWDGLLAFWFNMLIYVPWQFIVYVCIFKAIKSQPEEELDNFQPASGATYAW